MIIYITDGPEVNDPAELIAWIDITRPRTPVSYTDFRQLRILLDSVEQRWDRGVREAMKDVAVEKAKTSAKGKK